MLRKLAGLLLAASIIFTSFPIASAEITSTFDSDMENWVPASDVELEWISGGGVSGGFLFGKDIGGAQRPWGYVAPGKFLGNRSRAYGRTLTFHLRTDNLTSTNGDDVILNGPFLSIVTSLPGLPGTAWTPFSVTLDATGAWRNDTLGGIPATEADIRTVLADLHGIQIRGEYSNKPDEGGLDSVVLNLDGAANVTGFPLVANFDASDEGWYQMGPELSYRTTWHETEGNPGGFVSAEDVSGTWYFTAPSGWTGNLSAAYGTDLTFDLKQSSLATQYDAPDVMILQGDFRLVYDTPHNPQKTWTPYRVPLVAGGWRWESLDGPFATEPEMRAVLADVRSLRIRGEYRTWDDTGSLDNVRLGVAPLPGDATRDGKVDNADVAMVLRMAGGLLETNLLPVVDVEPPGGNGLVDIRDALGVFRFME